MFKHLLALAAAATLASPAVAVPSVQLSAGDIAIVGRTNNGSPDSFAVLTLADIGAGTVIYFTDNGWTGSAFRGSSPTDGDGNENLTRWTVTSRIAAGTIVSSTGAGFTTSGSIAGTTSGSYANLALNAGGDQIYAFLSTSASNPLANAGTQLFVLDDTNGFEAATSSSTGALPTGATGVSLNFTTGGTIAVKSSVLGGPSKTRAEWIAALTSPTNWAEATALPTGTVAVTAVPEPETYALMLAGLATVGFLARRRGA